MRLKRLVFIIALLTAAARVRAGEFDVVGNVNVASNLTAQSVTLGGQTRSSWPGGGLAGFQDLGHEPVLGTSEAGLFSIVLTNHAGWDFGSHMAGRTFRLQIAQDATGGWTNSWPAEVLWPGGTPVSATTDANRFSLFSVVDNGTHWLMEAGPTYGTNRAFAVSSLNVDGRVRAGNVSLSGVTAVTIEYWAKLRPSPGPYEAEGGTILSLNGNVGTWGWSDVFLWCGNLIWDDFLVYGGSAGNYANFGVSQYDAAVADGNWHHIAAVYDGSQYRLYLDGTLKASQSASISLPSAMDVWVLSYDWFPWHTEHVKGTMDEVRVSKVARYTSNFTPATSFTVDSDTLVYLKFDEGGGASYTDQTGNSTPVYVGNPPEWVEGR
jgi:hypothetical protein